MYCPAIHQQEILPQMASKVKDIMKNLQRMVTGMLIWFKNDTLVEIF